MKTILQTHTTLNIIYTYKMYTATHNLQKYTYKWSFFAVYSPTHTHTSRCTHIYTHIVVTWLIGVRSTMYMYIVVSCTPSNVCSSLAYFMMTYPLPGKLPIRTLVAGQLTNAYMYTHTYMYMRTHTHTHAHARMHTPHTHTHTHRNCSVAWTHGLKRRNHRENHMQCIFISLELY